MGKRRSRDAVEPLISQERIRERVAELGREITHDYAGRPVLLLGILKGSAIFLADLIREIDLVIDYDFVALSSYGGRTDTTGVVRITKDTAVDVRGKDVLIVDDIVDTGWTLRMSYLAENLLARGAAGVKVCALLDKPGRRLVDVNIDYRGFQIEDEFVVGYGLDHEGRFRNLPYIGVLQQIS